MTVLLPSQQAITPVTAAVSKAFPLFSRKSAPTTERTINIAFSTSEGPVTDQQTLDHAQALSDSVRMTAQLVDTPPQTLSTSAFLEKAQQVAGKYKDQVKLNAIVGEDLEAKGMGGIYNVGKASTTRAFS